MSKTDLNSNETTVLSYIVSTTTTYEGLYTKLMDVFTKYLEHKEDATLLSVKRTIKKLDKKGYCSYDESTDYITVKRKSMEVLPRCYLVSQFS